MSGLLFRSQVRQETRWVVRDVESVEWRREWGPSFSVSCHETGFPEKNMASVPAGGEDKGTATVPIYWARVSPGGCYLLTLRACQPDPITPGTTERPVEPHLQMDSCMKNEEVKNLQPCPFSQLNHRDVWVW